MATPLRVLIVEDSDDDAFFLLRELKKGGFEVTHERVETAEAMGTALDAGGWDLVISDYVVPGFGGLEALAMLQARELDLPFIMVSGKMGEEVAVEAMKAGAHDYLVKGRWERLIPAIAREMREANLRHEKRLAQQALARQVEHLRALRAIDMAITSSSDARVSVNVVLDKVDSELGVDAACVLRLNPYSQKLEFLVGRGFRTDALRFTWLRFGAGYAGRAAMERRMVSVPDLRQVPGAFSGSATLAMEGFVAYFAAPLVARGQVKGVMEVFLRRPLEVDQEWLDFLETLAGQAAIAIDNATMFEDLQQSNLELIMAYDATIEGWARALELRDLETKGHTRRVTEMTVNLARRMGLGGSQLAHVRRGAVLHDVGKMAIPDGILLKAGSLTEEELEVMRRHTTFATEMLSSIPFLQPAIDIPRCHHERWDGSGYPAGLKGEAIPLAARVFAVVDVWDALRSERPYKPAWPDREVREHLRGRAGTHFDPAVVEVFLELEWPAKEEPEGWSSELLVE